MKSSLPRYLSALAIVLSCLPQVLLAAPPRITLQPTNQTVALGDTAIFAVAAGGMTPLYYQWMHGGTNLTGRTNTVLTITNVQLPDAGVYSVVVSNRSGSTTSSNAVLTVLTSPPGISL